MARIQYQAKFDPIVVTAAPTTPTVDGWGQPPSVPVRRRGLSAAVRSTIGPVFTQPEAITADRFAPIFPDRVPRRRFSPNQQSTAWTPVPITAPLSPDFGFMVQAPRIQPRRGVVQHQQPFASGWPVPIVAPPGLALHALVTWVD